MVIHIVLSSSNVHEQAPFYVNWICLNVGDQWCYIITHLLCGHISSCQGSAVKYQAMNCEGWQVVTQWLYLGGRSSGSSHAPHVRLYVERLQECICSINLCRIDCEGWSLPGGWSEHWDWQLKISLDWSLPSYASNCAYILGWCHSVASISVAVF